MEAIYTAENTKAAYLLNWGVTLFWKNQPITEDVWLENLSNATETDGVRILKHRTIPNNASQFFVSTKPHVAPAEMLKSIKGRLQHHVRSAMPKAFQRNYCVRSIGAARSDIVKNYIADQLGHHQMADARVQNRFREFQRTNANVELKQPSFSSHGEYWYNLHIVLVNRNRSNEVRKEVLEKLASTLERTATKHRHQLSQLAVLSDHIHISVRAEVTQSPASIALSYLNNGAYACDMRPVFQFSYHVSTHGEYDRGAVH